MEASSAVDKGLVGVTPGGRDEARSGRLTRRLFLAVGALIVAFGVAFAAGAATRSHTAAPSRLAPNASLNGAQPSVVAVAPAPGLPSLKLRSPQPAAHSPAKVAPSITTPSVTTPPVTTPPVTTPVVTNPAPAPTVTPSPAPVVSAPAPTPVVRPAPTHTSTGGGTSSGTGVGSGGG